MKPFVITSDPSELRGADTRLVEVPVGLATREELFLWYVNVLSLPDFFGSNWDAFEECLRDLSWIKERRIVVFHRDAPLEMNKQDQRMYFAILASASHDWKPNEAHELVVAFDPACEPVLK